MNPLAKIILDAARKSQKDHVEKELDILMSKHGGESPDMYELVPYQTVIDLMSKMPGGEAVYSKKMNCVVSYHIKKIDEAPISPEFSTGYRVTDVITLAINKDGMCFQHKNSAAIVEEINKEYEEMQKDKRAFLDKMRAKIGEDEYIRLKNKFDL